MTTLWSYIAQHWLPIALIVGVLVAFWYVYKNKDKYIRGGNDK